MFKKITIALIAFMFIIPQVSFAHSALEKANPAKGATVSSEVQNITLTFSTKVEKGSSIKLKENGQAVKVDAITINNNQLTAKLKQPLRSATYTVIWEIIGADGHPVSGKYSFTVKNGTTPKADENQTEKKDTNNEDTANNTADQSDDKTSDSTAAANDNAQEEEESSNSLIAVIVTLGVIALGSFGWMVKKGKE